MNMPMTGTERGRQRRNETEGERERERDRERQTQSERKRQTGRETDRKTEKRQRDLLSIAGFGSLGLYHSGLSDAPGLSYKDKSCHNLLSCKILMN